jgi:alpha/beta hydrolase fold
MALCSEPEGTCLFSMSGSFGRRSPESRYPVAVEESYAVLKYAAEHPQEFGADASRIANRRARRSRCCRYPSDGRMTQNRTPLF